MKKFLITSCSFLIVNLLVAQNIEVYKNGFAGLSPGWSSNYFGQSDVNGSKFLYQEWSAGSVTNNTNQTFSTGFLFLFDKSGQSLYIRATNADTNNVLIIDKEQIKTFTLMTDKPHVFIPGKSYGPSYKNDFFEVLVQNDSAYTFLKLVTTKFVRADTHNMLKAINGDTKSSYVDDIFYFVSYKNAPLQKISLNEKNFKNLMSNNKAALENYLSNNKKKDKNEQFFIDLINIANN